jgi:hypothetical protein
MTFYDDHRRDMRNPRYLVVYLWTRWRLRRHLSGLVQWQDV